MNLTRLLTIISIVLSLICTGHSQTANVEPQSLIGQWTGNVTESVDAQYFLTITKVDGNNVVGKARAIGSKGGKTEWYDIFGTLQGNVLKYHTADNDLSVELVVDGDTMKGFGTRKRIGAYGKFSLTKTK